MLSGICRKNNRAAELLLRLGSKSKHRFRNRNQLFRAKTRENPPLGANCRMDTHPRILAELSKALRTSLLAEHLVSSEATMVALDLLTSLMAIRPNTRRLTHLHHQ
jgi:hypothetical protein